VTSAKFIVADASPLIGLARINHLDLLNNLFDEVILHTIVAEECTLNLSKPGAKVIDKAIQDKLLKVRTVKTDHSLANSLLDAGEIAAISLAKELQCAILIDDKQGRLTAKNNELKVIGLVGVLLLAKQRNLIPKVAPLLTDLIMMDYFIEKSLINEILKIAGE
jgi:predicted nucleic acid-binding protein